MEKKSKRSLVLKYYPNATCELRTWGKEYYIIWSNGNALGQGKNRRCAWAAAYKNINS